MRADKARKEAERGGWREREKHERQDRHECCHVSWQEGATPPEAHTHTVHLVHRHLYAHPTN